MEKFLSGRIVHETSPEEQVRLLSTFSEMYKYQLDLHEELFKLDLSRVFVAPSPIHGMGLFAAFDLPAHQIVTLFPASKGFGKYMANGASAFMLYHNVDVTGEELNPRYRLGLHHGNRSDFFIEADPNAPLRQGWLGHMINDVCTLESLTAKSVKRYMQTSDRQSNVGYVQFNSGLVAIVTKRAIKEGDELLMSYGPMFYAFSEERLIVYRDKSDEYTKYLKQIKHAIMMSFQNQLFLDTKLKEWNKNVHATLHNFAMFMSLVTNRLQEKKKEEEEAKRGAKAGITFNSYKSIS